MKTILALAGVVAGLVGLGAAGPSLAAISAPVKLDAGLVAGGPGRDPAISVFKGIPFAAPPVGDLRWKAPQPAAPWQGVRQATAFGANCPSPEARPGGPAMSEDCLYLNVWTGAASPAERRPVYVWIYGGGFIGGAGSDPQFDGEALAKKGVIVVTFNYRLGALGFLATPELSKESGHNASGDYGLMDDVAVLKWVKANIAAFGGDPSRVTIGGQSAGAGSSGFMAMSPLAKGLFRGVIAESHARYPRDLELRYLSVSYRTLKDAEATGTKYQADHGAHSLAELRALPWQKVIEGSDTVDMDVYTGSNAKPPLFRPVVDGWVLPHGYDDTYAKHLQNDVAFLAGNNRDETGALPEFAFARLRAQSGPPRAGLPATNLTLADFIANAKTKFGAMAAQFFKLYPAKTDDQAALAANDAARDNSRISTFLWASEWKQGADKPVYTYYWTHRPTGDPGGAHHGSEILFAFNNLDMVQRAWTDEDRKVADTLSSYWVNFITRSNPNGAGLAPWPQFDPRSEKVMEVGDHFAPIPVSTPPRLAFWKRFFARQTPW